MSNKSDNAQLLAQQVTLPCGRVVPNRLVKAPMEELQAPLGGGAAPDHSLQLYRSWADGGWGMIITGNIAIDQTHLGTPFDVTFKGETISSADMEHFKRYARVCKKQRDALPSSSSSSPPAAISSSSSSSTSSPLAVVQLVHAGRQSGRGFGRAPWKASKAPSAVPMATAKGSLPWPVSSVFDWALWGSCRAMTTQEVKALVKRFSDSAVICHDAGFDGVELHGSHGYMLAAFLSPKTNQRTDEYGGSARNRFRIIEEIILDIRKRVPGEFIVGIKLNSADYVHGGLTEDDALQNVQWLAELGCVDFVEISGGNYENPSFMMHDFNADDEMSKLSDPNGRSKEQQQQQQQHKNSKPNPPLKESTRNREAFFSGFAHRASSVLGPATPAKKAQMALILTGGLRSRNGCAMAIRDAGVDMCGLARASALDPSLPHRFLSPSIPDDQPAKTTVPVPKLAEKPPGFFSLLPLKVVGAGWTTLYHALQMARIVNGKSPDPQAGAWQLLGEWVGRPKVVAG